MHVPAHADHARHDLELVAAHVADDLSEIERTRAESLLQSCPSCADLRRDLIALAAATRSLPRAVPAPRDFSLDAAQAARLRRGSWLRAFLQPFGGPRSALRPAATAFTTLGVAGLLVVNILPSLLGGPGAAVPAGQTRDLSAEQAAPTTAAEAAPGGTVQPVRVNAGGLRPSNDGQYGAAAPPSAGVTVDPLKAGDAATQAPVAIAGGQATSDSAGPASPSDEALRSGAGGTSPLVVGSIALLVLGLALFGLRFAACRLR